MSVMTSNIQMPDSKAQCQRDIVGNQPIVLADIYRDEANIVIWQRNLSDALINAADHILKTMPALQTSITVNPKSAYETINNILGATQVTVALSEDITLLVDLFCSLFDLNHVGLRLTTLDHAMCPRFHVDWVPCRLVTTYQGVATQWLPHHLVDRSRLGAGNQSKPDEQSGLFQTATNIQQLNKGDVALLKGELWEGNEGAGLVHRSPQLANDARRLLFTLDFIKD